MKILEDGMTDDLVNTAPGTLSKVSTQLSGSCNQDRLPVTFRFVALERA